MSKIVFDEMPSVDEDGWTEWVHPLPGYLMKCCGCGFVHEMDAQVGKIAKRKKDGTFEWGYHLRKKLVVMFRMKRRDDLSEEPPPHIIATARREAEADQEAGAQR